MNLSQRLRTCAKHTGLDAVIELLQEAADEIDRLSAGKAADVTDERQAFDAWWESKQRETFPKDYSPDRLAGWGAAFKPDAWRAWQARSILALRPVHVPMTPTERERELDRSPVDASWEAGDAFMEGIYAAEARHDITTQAKKEGA